MVGGYENNVEVKDITEPNNCNLYLPNGCNWRDEYIILGTDVTPVYQRVIRLNVLGTK